MQCVLHSAYYAWKKRCATFSYFFVLDTRMEIIMTSHHSNAPSYTLGEELFNSISHGIGFLLSVAALVLAVIQAAFHGDAWCVVSAAIYGSTLILLYCMSTLYHSITHPTAKKVFRIFDHTTIFLLIAGTYTPITLVSMRGTIGWIIFGIVWGTAVLGIVLNSISIEKFKKFSMIAYIAMGWAVVIGVKPLINSMETRGLLLLVFGGLFYTIGIIFYALKKFKFMHSIWHLFVLAGSVLQYFAVYFYILPRNLLS